MLEAARTSETSGKFLPDYTAQQPRRQTPKSPWMMKAASTSETLVNFCQTARRNNPEDSHFIVLMMKEASISKTSVNFYQTARRNNTADSHLHRPDDEGSKYLQKRR
jgi:hypothetical protein